MLLPVAGKESTEGSESIGEAPGACERSHGEKTNGRYAKTNADTGTSAGTSTCKSQLHIIIYSFYWQFLFLIPSARK